MVIIIVLVIIIAVGVVIIIIIIIVLVDSVSFFRLSLKAPTHYQNQALVVGQ